MKFGIDVQGEPELRRVLDALPKRLRDVVLKQALRRAAEPILTQAKSNLASMVRVTGKRTDPLWSGMRIAASRRRKKGAVSVLVITPTRARLGIPPDDKWYYPAHIELGTRRTPALPFLRTALKSQRAQAIEIIRRELLRGIEAIGVGKLRQR